MSASNDMPVDNDPETARALLERLYYGHSRAVEAILRFASAHKLDDDNYVFLLVSILKGNEELVHWLLRAIESTDRVIDNSREAGKQLRGLEQKLAAQMEAAANRNAGKLNLAADRLAATVTQVDRLCVEIIHAGADLRRVEGVLDRALEIGQGKIALDRLIDQIRSQARADLKNYHSEIMEELSREVRREAWAVHAYGLTSLIAVICLVLWLALGR